MSQTCVHTIFLGTHYKFFCWAFLFVTYILNIHKRKLETSSNHSFSFFIKV
uniref:Uncharacterized protein n=1 Tax=Rhizophora mucronata TaxID=61149 RepID=A0A2P2NYA6_RHIMU